MTKFRDAQKHHGWFDLRLDPGNRLQTMSFEAHFRAKALDNLEAWGEVVFWKLFSGGTGPRRKAGRRVARFRCCCCRSLVVLRELHCESQSQVVQSLPMQAIQAACGGNRSHVPRVYLS